MVAIRKRFNALLGRKERCPECSAELVPRTGHCDSCGYDLATKTRASLPMPPVR